MANIDLIPEDYRRQRRVRLWLRNFAAFCVGLLVVIGVVAVMVNHVLNTHKAELAQLQRGKLLASSQKSQLQTLQTQRNELEQRLQILDSLRRGPAVEWVFLALDRALNDGVWFSELRFMRQGEFVSDEPEARNTDYFIVVPQSSGKPRTNDAVWRMRTHLEVKGQALTHFALAQFVEQLAEQPEVGNARLMNTSLRRYTQVNVVDFNLVAVINGASFAQHD